MAGMCWCRVCGAVLTLVASVLLASRATPVYNVSYQIDDNTDSGVTVGNVLMDTGLRTRYTAAERRELTLRIIAARGQESRLFGLDSATGSLYTNRQIDRDAICTGLPACDQALDIMAETRKSGSLSIVKVVVSVKDINDNTPVFPSNVLAVNISEIAQVGSEYIIPSAEDKDSPKNGIKTYAILETQDTFSIHRNILEPLSDLILKLEKPLDREMDNRYVLTLVAIDGGSPPRTGSVTLNVLVVDANDNRPEFTKVTYNITVPENLAPQSVILKVTATDPDSGLNGQVEYFLHTKTQQQYGDKFSLRRSSGELLLTSPLDYTDGREYVLSVVARDKGLNAMPAYAKVVLTVTDVNNHAPQVVASGGNAANASVIEGRELNRLVSYLVIRDADSGVSGEFSCNLDTRDFVIRHVYGSEYQILSSIPLDREIKDLYKFRILCMDRGSPSMQSMTPYSVQVEDDNDHQPVFDKDTISAFVNENAQIGTSLATVTATDADVGPNGRVRYKVASDSAGYIRVDAVTGKVTTSTIFDYERIKHKRLHVIAHDQGSPSLSSVAVISLTILDTNDRKPIFTKSSYSFSVPENINGTMVGRVEAMDDDSVQFSKIKYSLVYSSEDTKIFSIDTTRGAIYAHGTLDHERRSSYMFKVAATNVAAPHWQTLAAVTVRVTDENDNSPRFDFPRDVNNSIRVSGVVRVGRAIFVLRARDADSRANGRVSYAIVAGNQAGLFHLHPVSGALSIARDIAGITQRNFTLTLVAKDAGHPQRATATSLTVRLDESAIMAPPAPPRVGEQNSLVVIAVGCVAGFIIVVLVVILVAVKFFCRGQRRTPPAVKYHVGGNQDYIGRHDFALSPLPNITHDSFDNGSSGYSSCDVQKGELNLPAEFNRRTRLSFGGGGSDSGSRSNSFQIQREHIGQWQLPLEGDNNSSTEESITDSGRGGSEEGSITRTGESDNQHSTAAATKPEQTTTSGKNIPQRLPAVIPPGAHGTENDILRDGLTAMWAKYQNYTAPKKKHRVTFMEPSCVLKDREKCNIEGDSPPKIDTNLSQSKSDSHLSRKRKLSDYTDESTNPPYRTTMPTIQECRPPVTGTACESESDGETTTSGSYVVDLEDFSGLDNVNGSVMV